MEAYPITFDEALRTGLKNDARVPNGVQALDVCTGLRATRFGLKDFITITQPMSDAYLDTLTGSIGWPHPQLFRGKAVTLLCFAQNIYEINEADWTATEITLYNAADFGNASPGAFSITGSAPWHFMDFHTTWALFNGTTTIWKTGYYSQPIATNSVTIKTGCSMKGGRAFYGGFNPANFYSLADWPAYWETMNANAPAEIRAKAELMAEGAGTNWCWWSTIGGGDLLWLVSRDLYLNDTKPSPQIVSNGTFTGDATGWTLGTDWAYDTGNNRLVGTLTSDTAAQTSGNQLGSIIAGNSYSVSFTVSNHSAGTVLIALGAVAGTARSADGTYTQTIVAAADGATINITGTGFTGNIDTVSVTLVNSDSYPTGMSPWQEIMQRNEFGMAPMPWQGTVLHQRRLGDVMMAYGDGGITAMVPHSSPVATMGIRDPQGIGRTVGIASRSAVGGGVDGHVFVDSGGELWRMGPNLQAERLGYSYIFSNFLDNDIVVSHDPQRNEFYIAGNTGDAECYVLSETGLSKAPWVPTQVSFAEGGLISILIGDTMADVQVETNKFGARRRKHIDQITTVTLTTVDTDVTGWSVIVEYRFRKEEDFIQSASVACDARGVARMNVSGLEFRVLLTHPDRTKADLDAVEIEMVRDGRRSLNLLTP